MRSTPRGLHALFVAAAALLTAGCRETLVAKPITADEAYQVCASCHGAGGEGNQLYLAPAIAGLPRWYVQAQLEKFRNGYRGKHPHDDEGLRMRPMSRHLTSQREVELVSAYVSQLPKPQKVAHSLQGGDVTAGKATFATCLACHGANGQGNEALKAPPLAQLNDWYLLTQLKKWKAGVRGYHPADTVGATMKPMAQTLGDEQAMKNVIAYITTLSGVNP